jgi:AbrB family looped-hinge helix DNA binding protein
MTFQSRITSKGQVTVPAEIRRKLGLRQGDKVEFRENSGETVITRAPQTKSPFDKYAGILAKKLNHPFDSKKWLADLRDED